MKGTYTIPAQTRVGHVNLKVADLSRSLNFYCALLGFDLISKYGNDVAFISAGGYHHHIALNTWNSKDAKPASIRSPGLFHVAILYPTRGDLATIYQRLIMNDYPMTGVADHGVSESLYLSDPDENGVELYWDRPKTEWPIDKKGMIKRFSKPLDVSNLLKEI